MIGVSQRTDVTPRGQSGGCVLPTGSRMGKRRLREWKLLTQPGACDSLPPLPCGPVADGETETQFSHQLYFIGQVLSLLKSPCNGVRPLHPPSVTPGHVSRVIHKVQAVPSSLRDFLTGRKQHSQFHKWVTTATGPGFSLQTASDSNRLQQPVCWAAV